MKVKLIVKTMVDKKIYPAGSELTVEDTQARLMVKQGRAVELLETETHEAKKRKPRSKVKKGG